MHINKYYLPQDDRHAIRDPFGTTEHYKDPCRPEICDMDVFANTLMKTRIPDLFVSQEGLQGHAEQIQDQLNRIARVKNRSDEEVAKAICVSKLLRNALIKSRQAAIKKGFQLWLD